MCSATTPTATPSSRHWESELSVSDITVTRIDGLASYYAGLWDTPGQDLTLPGVVLAPGEKRSCLGGWSVGANQWARIHARYSDDGGVTSLETDDYWAPTPEPSTCAYSGGVPVPVAFWRAWRAWASRRRVSG